MLYEFHSNQSGDPDNVLCHSLGHWRMTEALHDLVFHPKVVVSVAVIILGDVHSLMYIARAHIALTSHQSTVVRTLKPSDHNVPVW